MPDVIKPALTVGEVAALMGFHPDTIRTMFARERGVIVTGSARSANGKRRYRSMRIPRFVYERVVRKVTV